MIHLVLFLLATVSTANEERWWNDEDRWWDNSGDFRPLFCRDEEKCFLNWHKSIMVGGRFEKLWKPGNLFNGQMIRAQSQNIEFLSGLETLQALVNETYEDGKRMRAYGSKWALSNAAYTDEVMVSSRDLTYIQVGMEEDHISEEFVSIRDRLAVVQAGAMVQQVSFALNEHGLALPTTGAGDGQRFAGAVSTGTHGSRWEYGSIQECVRAMHIVIPGEHVIIQPASHPVVTEDFAEYIGGARIINDDRLFAAALVGFGSFGIIHAHIIEAEPLYLLRMQSKQFDYSQIKPVLESLDPSSLGLDGIGRTMPFHFEVTFNSYRLNRDGCFVRVFEKLDLAQGERNSGLLKSYNPEKLGDFEAIGQAFGPALSLPLFPLAKRLVYGMVLQRVFKRIFRTRRSDGDLQRAAKKPYEWFTFELATAEQTSSPIPGTGVEIGLPADRVIEALEIILNIFKKDPLPGQVAVRFVKKSNATLAFSYYDLTATIEFSCPSDNLFFRKVKVIQRKVWDAIAASSIPHTYHWGQFHPLNKEWVPNAFGSDLDEWKQARSSFLGDALDMFSNEWMEDLALYP